MQNILVPGLGIGNAFGVCDSHNLDLRQLVSNTSILLLIEKIVLPTEMTQRPSNDNPFAAVEKFIIEKLYDGNLIETFDAKNDFDYKVCELFEHQAKNDWYYLQKNRNGNIIRTPDNMIEINGREYCFPYIASLYASLFVGKTYDASLLLSERDYTYLNELYSKAITKSNLSKLKLMDDVFSTYIPNNDEDDAISHLLGSAKCVKCAKMIECRDRLYSYVENALSEVFTLRQYDEIHQAREEMEKVVQEATNADPDVSAGEIRRLYEDRQQKINSRIRTVFPKAQRWSNIIAFVSAPVSVISACAGDPKAALIAAGLTATSKMVDEYIKWYKSKNNWVGFLNRMQK